jgi:hypothetical protein
MVTTESIVEMANLTGGMMTGLFPHPRAYKCPSGHITTLKDEFADLKRSLQRRSKHRETSAETATEPQPPAT